MSHRGRPLSFDYRHKRDRVIQLYKAGLTSMQIAERLDLNLTTVQKYLKKYKNDLKK